MQPQCHLGGPLAEVPSRGHSQPDLPDLLEPAAGILTNVAKRAAYAG